MNKQEMVKAIAGKTGLTQVDVSKVLGAFQELTTETLEKGEKVQITGFLNIKPVYRASRQGFDPLKKVHMEIPATVGVSVKAGEQLKKATAGLKVEDFAPEVEEDAK